MADYVITNVHTSPRHPGVVYAELRRGTELAISATLDYVLGQVAAQGIAARIELAPGLGQHVVHNWLGKLYRTT
jgi:hypothetical protein